MNEHTHTHGHIFYFKNFNHNFIKYVIYQWIFDSNDYDWFEFKFFQMLFFFAIHYSPRKIFPEHFQQSQFPLNSAASIMFSMYTTYWTFWFIMTIFFCYSTGGEKNEIRKI